MTYRETLNLLEQNHINPCDVIVAYSCDSIFNFTCSDNDFETLCDFAVTMYLKGDYVTADGVAKTINDLIVEEGKSVREVVEMDKWEFLDKAVSNSEETY